jgi:uncharacterized protein
MAQTNQTPTEQATPLAPGSHISDPAPLGLAAFALTTFVLSCVNTHILAPTVEPVVFGLALAYGGIGQFVAGLWEFAKGNTFGSTAFCSYGAFWVSFWWLTTHTDLSGANANDVGNALGVFLLAWAIFTLYMTVAASQTTNAVLLVFALLTVTFVFLAISDFQTSVGWQKLGGWFGMATAFAAWYASFAGVANFTFKRTVLPVGAR